MYFKRIRLVKSLYSRKSWRRFLFFVTVAVGINFNPFDSNLIWLSVKFALDRFFIYLSLFFEREEVDSFLRSLHFLVFVIFDFPFYFLLK